MIRTLSLCPTCYRKVEAEIVFTDGHVVMHKSCPDHGEFSAVVERDQQHFSNFYQYGTLGNNNTIIIHAHNECNINCPWCYYPMGVEKMHPFSYYHNVLGQYRGKYNLLLSGGEAVLRPDYLGFVCEATRHGWPVGTITNMVRLADPEFFANTLTDDFISGGIYRFAMSMQHPKNHSAEIDAAKWQALQNIEHAGVKAMCVMFSIQTLDELDYIRDFYNATKHLYKMLRIRTMFKNWANKGDSSNLFSSDLHKAFIAKFADLTPINSTRTERSNSYCQYLEMDNGMEVSLSSAPTVENVDYHLCSRPVFMLAGDGRCYPVPLAQIVNEGIASGWKDGYRIGGQPCGQ